MIATCVAFCTAPSVAQTWRITPAVSADLTFTNNVDLAPSGQRVADWVMQLTPSVQFQETGAHTRLIGSVSVPVLLYARTSENNYVAPDVNIRGTFEAIDRFLFVDATASVSQQFQNALGPRPQNLVNATDNRYTAQYYSISPYIKGVAPNRIDYELRQSSIWSDANASTLAGSRAYTNGIAGHVTQTPSPGGWSLEYSRSNVKFEQEQSETLEIARFRAIYRPDATWQVAAITGYEDNRLFHSRERGATYGLGVQWHPSIRTQLDANWEHRFFGGSYQLALEHRTPLSIWSVRASRDITSYPQQLADLAAGQNVPGLLNNLFISRIQDPLQRQLFVDQFIRDRGLPVQLTGPLALFTQQVTLVESEIATVGLIGARNTVLLSAYRSRNEPIETFEAASVTPLLDAFVPTTQLGATATWNHRLTANANLETSLGWSRTTENMQDNAVSHQYLLQTIASTPLSGLTSGHAGVRYQKLRSNFEGDANEFAVFVGISHIFH